MLTSKEIDIFVEIRRQEKIRKIGKILSLVGVSFLLSKSDMKLKKLKPESDKILNKVKIKLDEALNECKEIVNKIIANDMYLINSDKKDFLTKITKTMRQINDLRNNLPKEYNEEISKNLDRLDDIKSKIDSFNTNFLKKEIKKYSKLLERKDFKLDKEQVNAIFINDKYNQVIAGAGSGKTDVLITRAVYLSHKNKNNKDKPRILAIAFNSDASEQISSRIKDFFGEEYVNKIESKTFHQVGKHALKESGEINYPIPERWLKIEAIYNNHKSNLGYQELIIEYLKLFNSEPASDKKQKTIDDYYKSLNEGEILALNGEAVKSYGEKAIYDFLFTHKINGEDINFIYERPNEECEYLNKEGFRTLPKNDFFLCDYNIYLEHWAIDKHGNAPRNKDYADYVTNMDLKKNAFKKQKKYVLIETTFGEYIENKEKFSEVLKKRILSGLKETHPGKEFIIEKKSYKEIEKRLNELVKNAFNRIPKNIGAFISTAKTFDYTINDINKKIKNESTHIGVIFAKLAMPIWGEYSELLKQNNWIDFEDMINNGNRCMLSNKSLFSNRYDYILVDEFQDISKQRYNQIKILMELNPNARLFCVGDDWQSINGFAGSDLTYFTNFNDYFKESEITTFSKNHRSTKMIVEAGNKIMEVLIKDGKQISKIIEADENKKSEPLHIISTNHSADYAKQFLSYSIEKCMELIKELMTHEKIKYGDIMILTRVINYDKLKDGIKESSKIFDIPIKIIENNQKIEKERDYVTVSSIHKSKGLQSKVIILLNMIEGWFGFPNQIENPEILSLAMENPLKVTDPNEREAEERRLFYVALTRAKEKVYIFTQRQNESRFLKDIKPLSEIIPIGTKTNSYQLKIIEGKLKSIPHPS